MRIIYASAKDKILRYQIEDPFLKMFINKYEKRVPWGQIRTKEDITKFIGDVLVKELLEMITVGSENNNYLDDIDVLREFKINMNNPEVARAYQVYKRDPEESKKIVLEDINKNKYEAFWDWWKYVLANNDVYAKNPAFQYLMLKPVFDASPATKKNGPPALNEMAVASIYEKIEAGATQFNLAKSYNKSVVDLAMQKDNAKLSKDKDGWLHIPSKIKDPENFEANVAKLKTISMATTVWCTGTGMAHTYLSSGDFYLYMQGGAAKVAIRFSGDKIAEIQNDQNGRPFEFWEIITDFIETNNFDKESSHYKQLEKAKEINEKLDTDPAYIHIFRGEFLKDPSLFEMLSAERKKIPEFVDMAVEYWTMKISEANEPMGKGDANLSGGYASKLIQFNQAPKEVQDRLDPEIINLLLIEIDHSLKINFPFTISNFTNSHELLEKRGAMDVVVQSIEKPIEETPWFAGLLSPQLMASINPDLLERSKASEAYSVIVDLDGGGHYNPEEILEEHFTKFDNFYEKGQNELDEYYDALELSGDNLDKTLYNEKLITYIVENLPNYWTSYVSEDPIDRHKEFERYEGGEGRYEDYEGYEELRQLVEEAWRNKLRENPKAKSKMDSYMDEQVMYSDEEDSLGWYVDAWVEYVEKNVDELFDAKDYLGIYAPWKKEDNFFLIKYYNRIFSQAYQGLIMNHLDDDPSFFFGEDGRINLVNEYSSIISDNKEFFAQNLSKYIETNPTRLDHDFESVEKMFELDVISDEVLDEYKERRRQHHVENTRKYPQTYHGLDEEYKQDPDVLTAWESTIERWLELLWEHGEELLKKVPEKISKTPQFELGVSKWRTVKRFKSSPASAYDFEEIMSQYEPDEEFYDKAHHAARNRYFTAAHQPYRDWAYGTNTRETINEFSKSIPDFLKGDTEAITNIGNKIGVTLVTHGEGVTGDEVQNMDPLFQEVVFAKLKELIDGHYIGGLRNLLNLCKVLYEPYQRNPQEFSEKYLEAKNEFKVHLKEGTNNEYLFHNFPKIFENDQELVQLVRGLFMKKLDEPLPAHGYTNVSPILLEKGDVVEDDVEAKSNKKKVYSNWYRAQKMEKTSQEVKFINPEEVEETIRGFGSRRFSVLFTSIKNGRDIALNGQMRVQRAYKERNEENKGQGGYNKNQNPYMVIYDLQKASQIVGESMNDIDINEFDDTLLRGAYKRIYPHTVQYIKGDGQEFVVRESQYAYDNDIFEEEEDIPEQEEVGDGLPF